MRVLGVIQTVGSNILKCSSRKNEGISQIVTIGYTKIYASETVLFLFGEDLSLIFLQQ